MCFDVAREIKKGWNQEPKEREEKVQRDEERKTLKSSTSQFQSKRGSSGDYDVCVDIIKDFW